METEAQQTFLTELGCNTLQGYLLGKPVSAQTIKRFASRERSCPTHRVVSLFMWRHAHHRECRQNVIDQSRCLLIELKLSLFINQFLIIPLKKSVEHYQR